MIFKLLDKVVFGLNDKGIKYMLSGSVALNAYTVPRMTLDIDFIVRKSSEFRELEFARRRKMKIGNIETWIVSPEDLIISKIEWIQLYQSPKQIEDIKKLLEYTPLNVAYVNEWCKKLRLKTFELL
ncbi:MAG: hypothetical protein B6I19_05190 [Bacteroidetes bacterium 4572_114]|nr:MAG: hypothetical protein B6I19_05190 [Bacteroidetes bacterium 4572_114]